MVVRPRLLDRMRGRWFTRVMVIDAPAGYGKTTLLTQAMGGIGGNGGIGSTPLGLDCRIAWGGELNGGSETTTALGVALCEAVGATRPRAPRAEGDVVGEVVAAVSEAVHRRSPGHVALVIDDVHAVPPGSGAARLLARLVEGLPENGHLVLAGRTPPPVPLARLEVEGHVARLDMTDLAFTDDELTVFADLRQVVPSRLAVSGGWPSLAELIASTPGPASDLAGAMTDHMGRVVAALDPGRRRQLALLAQLGPFDDQLACAALDVTVDIDELVAGIPLVSRPVDGLSALHSHWRSVLAGVVDPAEAAASRRRAARLLVQRGAPDKAVSLLIDAEAWDELGGVLVVLLGTAHELVPRALLVEWYGRLLTAVEGGPYGELLAAVLAAEADPEGAWDRLERCAEAFRTAGSTTGEAACHAQLTWLAWWADDPERLAVAARRSAALDPARCREAAAVACLGRALLLDLQSDWRRMLVELDRMPPGLLSPTWQGLVKSLRSRALLQLGDAHQALAVAEHSLPPPGELHSPLAEALRAQVLWCSGRTTDALDAAPGLLDRLETLGNRNHVAVGTAEWSVAYSLVGDRDRASTLLARARAATTRADAPLIDTNLAIATAALAVANGDDASAAHTLAACLDRHPLLEGLSAGTHLRNLVLFYVLVPRTRSTWDRADLGPAHLVARDLARALAAVRDHRALPPETPPLPHVGVLQAHLPVPWIAELVDAAADADWTNGRPTREDTGPTIRPALAGSNGGQSDAQSDERRRSAAPTSVSRLSVPPSGRYHLRLLGPIELRRDDTVVDGPEWRRARVRALLAYLVLRGAVTRERIAEDLWPGHDPNTQSRHLRVTLTYLLRVLEPDRRPGDMPFFVRQHGANLTLHPGDRLEVDAWELDAVCQQAAGADDGSTPSVVDRGLRAAALWMSEPSELAAQPWAAASIERWRRRYTATVTRAGEVLLACGARERSLTLAQRALDVDPCLDRAHRLVVTAHQANDDDLAARRALARYYRQAVCELGVDEDEATIMANNMLRASSTTTGVSA